MGKRRRFSVGKAAGAWSWPLISIYCRSQECVELYLHCLNMPPWRGAQLKGSTGITLCFNRWVVQIAKLGTARHGVTHTHTHTHTQTILQLRPSLRSWFPFHPIQPSFILSSFLPLFLLNPLPIYSASPEEFGLTLYPSCLYPYLLSPFVCYPLLHS